MSRNDLGALSRRSNKFPVVCCPEGNWCSVSGRHPWSGDPEGGRLFWNILSVAGRAYMGSSVVTWSPTTCTTRSTRPTQPCHQHRMFPLYNMQSTSTYSSSEIITASRFTLFLPVSTVPLCYRCCFYLCIQVFTSPCYIPGITFRRELGVGRREEHGRKYS